MDKFKNSVVTIGNMLTARQTLFLSAVQGLSHLNFPTFHTLVTTL